MPNYFWSEINKHCEQGDCWIVIHSRVYNLSEYLPSHPGGRWIILKHAGKDATEAFEYTIHSPIAIEKMEELLIGEVDENTFK